MSDSGTGGGTGQAGRMVPAWLENLAALGWRVLAIVGFAVVVWYVSTLIQGGYRGERDHRLRLSRASTPA